jgi:glutamate-1-semialdehyde aminotransferase
MSNGYAISALVGRREIMQAMARTYVSSTFFTNSEAMVAALHTILKMERDQVIAHLWRIGHGLMEGLDRQAEEMGIAARVVGVPPMPF